MLWKKFSQGVGIWFRGPGAKQIAGPDDSDEGVFLLSMNFFWSSTVTISKGSLRHNDIQGGGARLSSDRCAVCEQRFLEFAVLAFENYIWKFIKFYRRTYHISTMLLTGSWMRHFSNPYHDTLPSLMPEQGQGSADGESLETTCFLKIWVQYLEMVCVIFCAITRPTWYAMK